MDERLAPPDDLVSRGTGAPRSKQSDVEPPRTLEQRATATRYIGSSDDLEGVFARYPAVDDDGERDVGCGAGAARVVERNSRDEPDIFLSELRPGVRDVPRSHDRLPGPFESPELPNANENANRKRRLSG